MTTFDPGHDEGSRAMVWTNGLSQEWSEALASTADQMRSVFAAIKRVAQCAERVYMRWDTYHALTARQVKRGREARRWVQSLAPEQRRKLRLVSEYRSRS